MVIHWFRVPALDGPHEEAFRRSLARIKGLPKVSSVETEICFNIELQAGEQIEGDQARKLRWLLSETFEQDKFGFESFLADANEQENHVFFAEVGPRLSFTTAWSENAVTICKACAIDNVSRIERSRRFRIVFEADVTAEHRGLLLNMIHDRMTECEYKERLSSFALEHEQTPVRSIPVMEKGKEALVEVSKELGLSFDDWDLEFYSSLFKDKMGRNPTDVECFDLAQSNSEHSRHWFFGGTMVIDDKKKDKTLFQMVKATNSKSKNSVIAFNDNSSAIQGFGIRRVTAPQDPHAPECGPRKYDFEDVEMHGILTCETHNFPCGIAPFPGAETGTGGRIRDVQATGRGAHVVAGTSSYCVGNLNIPGYELPWEDISFEYPTNMASPLQIEIEASNGASDYGNKFGEPVIAGYTRSFGQRLPNGERREWIKPIMMSAGVGLLDSKHSKKGQPEKGMVVVKVGGPAYRIGMGGGAASSRVTDEKTASLDFNAVQRGDAEMENKMNRVIRACIEMGKANPIVSIHDQGAGGNGNVLKEISDPAGAEIFLRRLPVGDDTMTAMELWGAEYQENNALLIREEHQSLFRAICMRENMPFGFIGTITGDGKIRVHDERDGSICVDLALEDVLGKMPQKTFISEHTTKRLEPFSLPANDVSLGDALDRVLRLLQVGSKRFLTNKVDRCVTGLVAQQQCVGPLHTPLANCGVIAQSHFPSPITGTYTGVATAIGEQPIKGLVDTKVMARLAVGEALTNLVWAKVTALSDVKCSGNWMWAAKLKGEGAEMYDACEAMCEALEQVGVGVDGGKDSLSMAANAGGETVKAPGQLCISVYAMCPDVTLTVTPDLKPEGGDLQVLFIDLSGDVNRFHLGGTALAQVYKQIGDKCADVQDMSTLVRGFNVTQTLIQSRHIAAGHDRSDGGLITALLEMAFAANVGLEITLPEEADGDRMGYLFSEGLGLLIQPKENQTANIVDAFKEANLSCTSIARILPEEDRITVFDTSRAFQLLDRTMTSLRDIWEATSFELDKLQASPSCVESEQALHSSRLKPPSYSLSFVPQADNLDPNSSTRVGILREEGSNGDREMAAAFLAAGFQVWDITVSDLLRGKVSLSEYRGLVFVGGFSYADVLDSAKGWAGVIQFNEAVWKQFQEFYVRKDTFSFGVCNGCQLMALLGWVPGLEPNAPTDWTKQPRFIHNSSGRFESRFSTVKIAKHNKAIMLKGMEGSTLGVWIAHGEGRAHFPDESILGKVESNNLVPIRYVDDEGNPTQTYPFNPNGSTNAIAAMCSPDGRHLAMMPHPERAFRLWQWPYVPTQWKSTIEASPWLQIFHNAKSWCDSH